MMKSIYFFLSLGLFIGLPLYSPLGVGNQPLDKMIIHDKNIEVKKGTTKAAVETTEVDLPKCNKSLLRQVQTVCNGKGMEVAKLVSQTGGIIGQGVAGASGDVKNIHIASGAGGAADATINTAFAANCLSKIGTCEDTCETQASNCRNCLKSKNPEDINCQKCFGVETVESNNLTREKIQDQKEDFEEISGQCEAFSMNGYGGIAQAAMGTLQAGLSAWAISLLNKGNGATTNQAPAQAPTNIDIGDGASPFGFSDPNTNAPTSSIAGAVDSQNAELAPDDDFGPSGEEDLADETLAGNEDSSSKGDGNSASSGEGGSNGLSSNGGTGSNNDPKKKRVRPYYRSFSSLGGSSSSGGANRGYGKTNHEDGKEKWNMGRTKVSKNSNKQSSRALRSVNSAASGGKHGNIFEKMTGIFESYCRKGKGPCQ